MRGDVLPYFLYIGMRLTDTIQTCLDEGHHVINQYNQNI